MTTVPILDPLELPRRHEAAPRVAALFERHSRMAYALCRAMLRDPQEAEDATQQVFLSAYRALLSGSRVRDEAAWIATIARNECRTRIGAGMRIPLSSRDDDLIEIAATGDETERHSHVEAIRCALEALPPRQREAVVLRYLYGLPYGEVATALGLSRPATEALLFRARRAMRVRLRPVLGSMLVVPLAVRDRVAETIPSFPTTGGGVSSVATAGLLAKFTAAPAAAKLATAALALTTVGAVAAETQRGHQDARSTPGTASSTAGDAKAQAIGQTAENVKARARVRFPESPARVSSPRRKIRGGSALEQRSRDRGDDGSTEERSGSPQEQGETTSETTNSGTGSSSGSTNASEPTDSSGPGPGPTSTTDHTGESSTSGTSGSSSGSDSSGPSISSGSSSGSGDSGTSGTSLSSGDGSSGSGSSGSGDGSSGSGVSGGH